MGLKRFTIKAAAVLLGAAVVVSAARDRFGDAPLPSADACLSAVGINRCSGDIVVLAGDDPAGRRIWLAPGRALPPEAEGPFHACEIPTLPARVPHRLIPGATVWGCELPPRLRDGAPALR
ncbi:hypothetical protein [Limimaricola pyoseonensis]|uniref:Uncharacterized protein n=1 Tax=Limimaricola pyoseonensis TaxID=521013 RepID=A0A1G7AMZ3_9RHOB|nr:hypothetical protein [Limimaricola pyoseonensis]SDE16181.1 hypothetical protein SAMN04488567_1038 [Limimaricola pyoseonensis]